MNKYYEIRKDVPIPEKRKPRRLSKWRSFAEIMEVGDSMLVPRREHYNLIHNLQELGFRAVTRSIDKRSIYVWKMNKEETSSKNDALNSNGT